MKVVTADFNAIHGDTISAIAYGDEPTLRERVLVHDGEGNYWMGDVVSLTVASKRVLVKVALHQPSSKGWICAEDVAVLVAHEIQGRSNSSVENDIPERLFRLQPGAWIAIVNEEGTGSSATRIQGDSLYPDHHLPGLADLVAKLRSGA